MGVSRPVGRVLCARLRGAAVIHLGLPLPAASCGLPASIGRAALERSRRPAPFGASPLDLAPGGVYRAAAVTCGAGGLLHHRFTLTPRARGGLFSVALSRGLPRVGVTDHPAVWSPDLPHRTAGPARPPGRLTRDSGYAGMRESGFKATAMMMSVSSTMALRGTRVPIRVASWLLALVVIVAGGVTLWYRQAYNVWPGQGASARVHWCGRDYENSGGPTMTLRAISAQAPFPVQPVGQYPPLGLSRQQLFAAV